VRGAIDAAVSAIKAAIFLETGWMDAAIQHLVDKGFHPRAILDIGAAQGFWSCKYSTFFKEARIDMIDPLVENEASLQKLCQAQERFHYQLCAVGRECGTQT